MKKILSVLMCLLVLCGCSPKEEEPLGELRVTMLPVGKADAIIIRTAEHTALIDCGEKNDGKQIVKFLDENDISDIDYMIITHFDQDHVGGASKVIKKKNVSNIIVTDYVEESKECTNFYEAADEKNIIPSVVTETVNFSLGSAEFTVYPPQREKYKSDSDNNRSLVTAVTYGGTNMLFTGDATELRLEEIMGAGHFDFLKIPYHGRKIANLGDFLDKVTPSLAAVSTSEEEFEIKEILEERNIVYKATFCDGQIDIVSDGKNISME